jgi:hypothetical protein
MTRAIVCRSQLAPLTDWLSWTGQRFQPWQESAKKYLPDFGAQLIRVCRRNILKFSLFDVINDYRLCAGAYTKAFPQSSVHKRLSDCFLQKVRAFSIWGEFFHNFVHVSTKVFARRTAKNSVGFEGVFQ